MITTLHIQNIGIIEDLIMDFKEGLNVLTGETGAGKSLIIDSLSIICGGRFSKEMIRKGAESSFIEACFYEPNCEKSIEGNIIVSREIYTNGRNLCRINGRFVTVNELKEFMIDFIEIHGQNDNQCLLDTKFHLSYLDGFIGKEIEELKINYLEKFKEWKVLKKELNANYGDEKERERRLDLLKYQYQEIEDSNLKIQEEDVLEDTRKFMMNAEKINENLRQADQLLSENTIDSLSTVIRCFEQIEKIDIKYEKMSSGLKNLYYDLQEMGRDISSYRDDMCFDEAERNSVEERLDLIYSLKRKYGNTVEEILTYREAIAKEIDTIENLEQYRNSLRDKITILEKEMIRLTNQIHMLRFNFAEILSEKINQILTELEMKNANIHIHIEEQDEFLENGKDFVEFYIRTNLGEEEKPLSKIASGGEMSRIMLAIKKVLAEVDQVPVLIFDEIDTGISGKAANCVADMLSTISKNHQILCISHLPNIAAMADSHYFISKQVEENRTYTKIQVLQEHEVIEEIARISSGEVNDVTIQYAKKLRSKKVS